MRVLGYLYRPCYRFSAAWLLPCSARPSMQPPQPSRWRCGAGIRDPVYRRCATSSTHSCTALRRSAGSGIGPLALAAALSPLAAAPAARQRLSRVSYEAASYLEEPEQCSRRLHSHCCGGCLCCGATACLSRSSECSSQLHCHCGGCLCCGATACLSRSGEGSSQLHCHCGGCLCCPLPLRRLPLLRSDCRSSECSSQLHCLPLWLLDAFANGASCEAHPVAHVNTRQGLPLSRSDCRSSEGSSQLHCHAPWPMAAVFIYTYVSYSSCRVPPPPSLPTSGRCCCCGSPPGGGRC